MSLDKYVQQPVSYFRFSHHYSKLDHDCGTTVRFSLKDKSGYEKKTRDLVWMIHGKQKFKAVIEKLEKKAIIDIPLKVLQDDVAPFKISRHLDFLAILQQFYDFPLSLDMKIWVVYWRRIE